MNFLSLKNPNFWNISLKYSIYFFGLIASLFTIIGVSFFNIFPNTTWFIRLKYLFLFFAGLMIAISFIRIISIQFGIKFKINGITVIIKQGDIFKANGKKVIPLNEYFDTIVDDSKIAKNSLHGFFINNIADKNKLIHVINNSDENVTLFKKYIKNGRPAFPLGRIITYDDYLLLSFTEFNKQNEAHLTKLMYENCLVNMWKEICRTYANNPVFLPLLGSGITRIDDWRERTNLDLLKCMIRTLNKSEVDMKQSITILLKDNAMRNTDIFELKGVKYI
jgi:hypothetical protein